MHLSYYPEFFTATILRWQHLLADDQCKHIIINSLEWLTSHKRCVVFAFVLMPNHLHLLWKIADGHKRTQVQAALLSYTAHEFKRYMSQVNSQALGNYLVADSDRTYQFWEKYPMVKECRTHEFFMQKLEYIHSNPCQPHWNLVTIPEEYKWSSAAFYEINSNEFPC